MLREAIKRFLVRASDIALIGRNGARIVLGTDRKDVASSGYGDGGANEIGAGAIDICAGYEEENVSYSSDKSRLYLAAKTNPDDYFGTAKGQNIKKTPAAVLKSDQVYILARRNIKIINNGVSILIKEDGGIEIEASSGVELKSGNGIINIDPSGAINIGTESGPAERILTENAVCVGIDPVTGAPIPCSFLHPLAVIPNINKKIKL
jgi:hypothetical protein